MTLQEIRQALDALYELHKAHAITLKPLDLTKLAVHRDFLAKENPPQKYQWNAECFLEIMQFVYAPPSQTE